MNHHHRSGYVRVPRGEERGAQCVCVCVVRERERESKWDLILMLSKLRPYDPQLVLYTQFSTTADVTQLEISLKKQTIDRLNMWESFMPRLYYIRITPS